MVHMGMGQEDFLDVHGIKAQLADGFQKQVQILHYGCIDDRKTFFRIHKKASNPYVSYIINPGRYPKRLDGHLPGHVPRFIHNILWGYLYHIAHNRLSSFSNSILYHLATAAAAFF